MTEIEPYLVELIIKLSSMRMPITSSHGLGLANSLMREQPTKKRSLRGRKKTVLLFESTETRSLVKDIGRHS